MSEVGRPKERATIKPEVSPVPKKIEPVTTPVEEPVKVGADA